MGIIVDCDRADCGAIADIGMEADWTTPYRGNYDPFADCLYGDRILVALPEGWGIDRVALGEVIHCPDHRS
jgi:hypothetical protein